jgi:prepilin-type processing-associated H-X9-DG protein
VNNLSDGGTGRSMDDPTANNYSVASANSGAGSYTVQQAGGSTPSMMLLKAAYPSAAGWLPFGKEHTYEPMRLQMIQKAGVSLSDFWEVGDYDVPATGSAKFDMAITPVHKKSRNFVYFDAHVENRLVPPTFLYDQ